MDNESKINKLNKSQAVAFHYTLFLLFIHSICPLPLSNMMHIIIIGQSGNVALLFIDICLCIFAIKNKLHLLDHLKKIARCNKLLFILLGFYLLWDFINVLYSKNPQYSIRKYIILAQEIFLIINMLYYVTPINFEVQVIVNKFKRVLVNLSIMACVIVIVAWWGYCSMKYTCYGFKLSTITDYNVFAGAIIIGLIAFVHLILYNASIQNMWRVVGLILIGGIMSATVYLSSSRRGLLMLILIFSVTFFTFCVIIPLKEHKMENFILVRILKGIVVSVTLVVVVTGISFIFYSLSQSEMGKSIEKTQIDWKGSSANTRAMSLSEGGAFDTRRTIWRTTIKWIKISTINEIIVGGGQSKSFDIFEDLEDPKNEELRNLYNNPLKDTKQWMSPHNLLLNDFLEGGLIKVILVVVVLVLLVVLLIDVLRTNYKLGITLFLMSCFVCTNLILGGQYGLLGNESTAVILGLLLASRSSNI